MPNRLKARPRPVTQAVSPPKRFAFFRNPDGDVSIRTVSRSTDQVYFLEPSKPSGTPLRDHLDGQPAVRQAILDYAAHLTMSKDGSSPRPRDFAEFLQFFPQESSKLLSQVEQEASEAIAKLAVQSRSLATQAALAQWQTVRAETRTSYLRDRLAYHIAVHGMAVQQIEEKALDELVEKLVVRERDLSACKQVSRMLEDVGGQTEETVKKLLALDLCDEDSISLEAAFGVARYSLGEDDEAIVTGYELKQFECGILQDKALKRHLQSAGLEHCRSAGPSDDGRLLSDEGIAVLKADIRLDGRSEAAEAVVRALYDATSDLKDCAQRATDSASDLMSEILAQPSRIEALDRLEGCVSKQQQVTALRRVSEALLDAIGDGTGHVIDALELSNDEIRASVSRLDRKMADDMVVYNWLRAARAERTLQRQAMSTVLDALQQSLRDDAFIDCDIPEPSYQELKDRALSQLRKKHGGNAQEAAVDLNDSLQQRLGHVPSTLPNNLSELQELLYHNSSDGAEEEHTGAIGQEEPKVNQSSTSLLLSWLDDLDKEERRPVLQSMKKHLSTIQEKAPPIHPDHDTGKLQEVHAEILHRLDRDRPRRLSETDLGSGSGSVDTRRGSVLSFDSESKALRPFSAGV